MDLFGVPTPVQSLYTHVLLFSLARGWNLEGWKHGSLEQHGELSLGEDHVLDEIIHDYLSLVKILRFLSLIPRSWLG